MDATNLSSSLNVALSGSGEDFQLVVTGSPSAVIVSGQTATYALQVAPVNGSAPTLTMGCTGVPQNATCTVNPVTLSVANGGTGKATVTVTTVSANTSSSANTFFDHWRKTSFALATLLPAALFGLRRRKRLPRSWFVCLVAVLTVAFLLLPMA